MPVNSSNLSSGTKTLTHKGSQKNETLRHPYSHAPKRTHIIMEKGQNITFSAPVLKKKSARWYLEWRIIYPGGIAIRQKRSFGINRGKSIREKTKLAQQAIKNFKPQNYLPRTQLPSARVISSKKIVAYINEYKSFWKKKTTNTYSGKLNIFSNWLEQKNIEPQQLTAAGARQFMQYLIVTRKLGHTTCNAYRATLWQMYHSWNETKKQNPFDEIKAYPDSKTGKKAFSTTERNEVIKYIKKEDPFLFTFISFMHYCFLRPDEIRHLKISSLDWNQQTIQLPHTNSKTNRNRVHAIPPVFIEQLKYLKQFNPDAFVFGHQLMPSKKMVGTTFWYRRMKKILIKFKFSSDYSLYSWRHTAAVELYKKHKDIRLVQMAMQHTTVNTTEKYLRSLGVLEDIRLFDRDEL